MIPIIPASGMSDIFSRTLNMDSATWGGYTWVLYIPQALLVPFTSFKLTIDGPASGVTNISKMYVGLKGTDNYDFASTPTQITAGASNSFVAPQGGSVVTDEIAFSYDASTPLVFSAYFGASSNIRGVFSGAGCSHYFKSGDEASTLNKSGYDSGGANPNLCTLISKIEAS